MSHSNNHETIVAGVTVVKNSESKILFLKRSEEESYGANQWDFPGGAKEFLETPQEGAIRETKEEAGIDVKIEKFLQYKVTKGQLRDDLEFIVFFYLCSPLSNEIKISHEHTEYKWLSLQEAKEYDTVHWMKDFIKDVESGEISFE